MRDSVCRQGWSTTQAPWLQVQKLLRLLGFSSSRQDVDRAVSQLDVDGDGEVSWEEFLGVLSGLRKPAYTAAQLRQAFHLLATKACPAHHISRDALVAQLVSASLLLLQQAQRWRVSDPASPAGQQLPPQPQRGGAPGGPPGHWGIPHQLSCSPGTIHVRLQMSAPWVLS